MEEDRKEDAWWWEENKMSFSHSSIFLPFYQFPQIKISKLGFTKITHLGITNCFCAISSAVVTVTSFEYILIAFSLKDFYSRNKSARRMNTDALERWFSPLEDLKTLSSFWREIDGFRRHSVLVDDHLTVKVIFLAKVPWWVTIVATRHVNGLQTRRGKKSALIRCDPVHP